VKIKGIAYVASRKPGRPVLWYVYAWRGGPCIMRQEGGPRPALTADAVAAYQRIMDEQRQDKLDRFPGLISSYRQSKAWAALAPSTRKVWGGILNRIEEKWSDTSVKLWSDPRMVAKVVAWRDSMAETPRAADNGLTVLHHMLEWARLRGRVTINIAAGIPSIYEGGNRAEIIWTEDDLASAEKVANQAVFDAIRLACLTGLRRADLAALTWTDVRDKMIIVLAAKSSRKRRRQAIVPLYGELRALLEELRTRHRKKGVETVLVTSAGNPWSGDGLGQRVAEVVRSAGIAHDDGRAKHLHDCRGTFATRLILAGFTDQQAADVLAWAPDRVANIRKVYVDRMRVVVALADRLDASSAAKRSAKRGGEN
jgi:integrase